MSETMKHPPASESVEKKPEQDQVQVVSPTSASAPDVTPVLHSPETSTQNLVHIEPKKREKTWGEIEFNLKTYGGWGLIGNEVASLGITESVQKGADGTPRLAHKPYKKFEAIFEGWSKHFERFKNPGLMRYIGDYSTGMKSLGHLPRLPYLLVATIGGMFMVPFIKDREDRKGEIVRKLDRKHYGAQVDNDPRFIEAHKEMDESPKQSWGSLWKGRITTVFFAALADFTFGWPEALTTKLFKNNTTYQKFSSLERISDAFANWSSKAANIKPANEKLFKKVVGNGTWLLTLSTSLTALFYFSSKLFARKRDEKIERREMRAHGMDGRDEAPEAAEQTPQKKAMTAALPTTQIHSADRKETVAAPPALAQGA